MSRLPVAVLCSIIFAGCAPDVGIKPLPHVAAVRTPEFQQSVGNLLGAGFTAGNRITTLQNGDQIFPLMLRSIRSATQTITFETYVFEKGDIPQAFAEAFAERARAGVKVLLLLDAQGGGKSKTYDSLLKDSGAQVVRYRPAYYPNILRYNNRTHRKLLVVDGRVAFIGGVGIADSWAGHAQSPDHWRDNHYRLEGPVVAQVQAAFADNWLHARKEILVGADYFPPLPAVGSAVASVFYAAPQHGSFGVPILYHVAIAAAAKSILIQNAYFVPDKDAIAALVGATRRGVRVQIIVPGEHIDHPKVRRASRKRWEPLLEAGVEIYEYKPTMIHSKLLIVDGAFVSVGSANFDNRSLHLNDEANMNVLDQSFAREQTRIFERDLAKSKRMTLEEYRDIGVGEKLMWLITSPIEGQL